MASLNDPPDPEAPGSQGVRPDWAALYGQHRERMLRVAANRLRLAGRDTSQAQDIVQTVFVGVMEKSPEGIDNWEAYLVRATTNRVKDHLSAAEARRAFPVGTESEEGADLLDQAADYDLEEQALLDLRSEQLRHRIRELLFGLPEPQRQVVRHRLFDGLANVDIAPLLGVTPQRVSQLWKAGFGSLMSALHNDPAIWLDDEDGTTGD